MKQTHHNFMLGCLIASLSMGTLTACGGGGGGGSTSRIEQPASETPEQPDGDQNVPAPAEPEDTVVEGNAAPVAADLVITDSNPGKVLSFDVLTASYSYSDSESDVEADSVIAWYRNGELIAGATSLTYSLTEQDTGKDIHFSVKPVAESGTTIGEVVSSSVVVPLDKYFLPLYGKDDQTNHTNIGFISADGEVTTYGSQELGHVYTATPFMGKALLWTESEANGIEPWVTDGYAGGTHLLVDSLPGVGSGGTAQSNFVISGDRAYFIANDRLWVTDGSVNGTIELTGAGESFAGKQLSNLRDMVGGVLFMTRTDNGFGNEVSTLWMSNGTVEGTSSIPVIVSFSNIQVINHKQDTLVLATNDSRLDFSLYKLNTELKTAAWIMNMPTGLEAIKTDFDSYPDVLGFETSTTLCISFDERNFIPNPNVTEDNPNLFLPTLPTPVNYCTTGATENIRLFTNTDFGVPSANPAIIGLTNDDKFYMAGKMFGSFIKNSLHIADVDGSAAVGLIVPEPTVDALGTIIGSSGIVFNNVFLSATGINGKDMLIIDNNVYSTEGTLDTTVSIGATTYSNVLTEVNDQLFFPTFELISDPGVPTGLYSTKMHLTDGTAAGTYYAIVFEETYGNALPAFSVGDKAYFLMGGIGDPDPLTYSLYESDGTEAGTKLVISNNSNFNTRFAK